MKKSKKALIAGIIVFLIITILSVLTGNKWLVSAEGGAIIGILTGFGVYTCSD